MQNQVEKITKIVEEIQSLLVDLKHVNTYNSVISNFYKINELYEKAVFIKNLNAYKLTFPTEIPSKIVEEGKLISENIHFEDENLKLINEIEETKASFDVFENDEINNEIRIDIEPNNELKLDIINQENIEEINKEDDLLSQEKFSSEKVLNTHDDDLEINGLEKKIEKNTNFQDDTTDNIKVSEQTNLDNLKIQLTKLKNKMEVSLPESELEITQRFELSNDEKEFYIKELFQNNFLEWSQTMEKIIEIEKVDEASKYLSEIYYKKNWKNKEGIAQRFWSKIEKGFAI